MLPGGEVRPNPQSTQDTDPRPDLYFPDSHLVQGPPSGPEKPGLHLQLVSDALARGETEPDGHEVHVATIVAAGSEENVSATQLVQDPDPCADLYFPAIHSTQVSPEMPVNPALQVHSEKSVDAASECELSGQA